MVSQATQTQKAVAQEAAVPENLPPSARDFEAYRLVKVEKKSTRTVAKLLHLSQTRVCQVIARVAEYLVDVTQPEDEVRREKQLQVAKQVAAEQIDYCMQRALHSYDRSCTTLRTVREVENPQGQVTRITTTRENFGETRYLTTIARLAVIGSNLPICILPIAVRRSTAEIRCEAEVEQTDVLPASKHEAPSEEACSVEAAEQTTAAAEQSIDEAERLEAIRLYNRGMRMLNMPEKQISETVQPAESTVAFEPRRPSKLERKRMRRDQRKQRSANVAS